MAWCDTGTRTDAGTAGAAPGEFPLAVEDILSRWGLYLFPVGSDHPRT